MTAALTTLSALALAATMASCVASKDARIGMENALDETTTHEYAWGHVECGEGQVCSEVAVSRVDVHGASDGGPVEVTLLNRTLDSVAVQVQLETFDEDGHRTDVTGFHDVALAPRSQSVLTLWQQLDHGDKLVIHLRARDT